MKLAEYRKILEELEAIYPEVPTRKGNWLAGREPEPFRSFNIKLIVLIHELTTALWQPPYRQEARELRARAERLEERFQTEKN